MDFAETDRGARLPAQFPSVALHKYICCATGLTSESEIWLCMWCDAAIKRANHIMKIAEESQTILENCKMVNTDRNLNNIGNTGVFNLTYIHNNHIDIPPLKNDDKEAFHEENIRIFNQASFISEEFQKDHSEEVKNEGSNFFDDDEITISCLEDEISDEEKPDAKLAEEKCKNEKRSRNKKQIDYKELKFDVTYLKVKEQLKEIEVKKQSEKYNNMKFKCEKCGVGYMFEDIFEGHMKRHKNKLQVSLYFDSKHVLSQHTLAHRRRFTCLLCHAKFTRWRHCLLHRYRCDGIQEYVACQLCSKVFSNAISLDIHTKGVHKEKKYECSDCHRRFATKHRLAVHIRCHSSLRAYSCTVCARTFTTQYNLRAHAHVHTHVLQYYCVDCNTYYKTQKGLDRHYRESRRHLDEKELRFKCPECPKRFAKENLLSSHINIRHLTTYKCDLCDKNFSSNTNLRKHVRCVHAKAKIN